MCVFNNRVRCNHMHVLDRDRVKQTGQELIDLIVSEEKRRTGNEAMTLLDLMPEQATQCITGVNSNGEPVLSSVDLRVSVANDGTLTREFKDYLYVMKHTEETDAVKTDTIVYCPEAITREDDVLNIDFDAEGQIVRQRACSICLYYKRSDEEDTMCITNVRSQTRSVEYCFGHISRSHARSAKSVLFLSTSTRRG